MAVPSRRESARLLLTLDPPEWHLRHSRAVAEIAVWLAQAAVHAGRAVDAGLVAAAALLHDVDKLPLAKREVGDLPHGEGSGRWLAERGYRELAAPVAAHPVTRLADGAWFEDWLARATAEELIVAYADKRAGQRLESMAERFASWERRYPPADDRRDGWTRETLAEVRTRAAEVERRACELADIAPGEVRRARWTAAAIRAAAR